MPGQRGERDRERKPTPAERPSADATVLNHAANAAINMNGSIFQILYRRYVPRPGHQQTIGVIAHRLCRLIWKILHQGVRYEERGPALNARSKRTRAARMVRELRSLGYRVDAAPVESGSMA